ncbi:hypothetical protein Bca4012_018743 [Brassica carinata]|uniref:Uncharacterized protein n=1 Tax=Brassica carinata TaxID=52824 RepID=A0A8X7WIP2_BRACI|nr:hypothetical protein Bca52824_002878 [Brassica carinata]
MGLGSSSSGDENCRSVEQDVGDQKAFDVNYEQEDVMLPASKKEFMLVTSRGIRMLMGTDCGNISMLFQSCGTDESCPLDDSDCSEWYMEYTRHTAIAEKFVNQMANGQCDELKAEKDLKSHDEHLRLVRARKDRAITMHNDVLETCNTRLEKVRKYLGLWKAVKKREEQAREALEEARAKEAHAVILKEGGVIDGARRSADRGGAKGVVLQF